jgi:CheY-like chemotaxis protein
MPSRWGGPAAELEHAGIRARFLGLNVAPKTVAEMAHEDRAVVIVDLHPRLIRAMETIRACRKGSPGTPVVVISDSPSVELARAIRGSGVFYLALHPVSMDELRSVLEDAFDVLGSRYSVASSCEGLKTILLIDGDPDFTAAVETLLRDHGYGVTTASSSREGLRKIAGDRPDLIVLDVMMESDPAGYSVTDTLEHARRDPETRTIPILMVSRAKTWPVTRFCTATGGAPFRPDAHMTKPLDIPVFLQTVRVLLGLRESREVVHA